MLDQNTDRMWYVIGAIVIGAAIIAMGLNIFSDSFDSVDSMIVDLVEVAEDRVSSINGGIRTEDEIDHLIDNDGYIPVATANELDSIRKSELQTFGVGTKWEGSYTSGLNKNYVQVSNINLSSYSSSNGWLPIGQRDSEYSGVYDGNGYIIQNLYVNRPNVEYVGLFGIIKQANLKNIILNNANVIGLKNVGSLVGRASGSKISMSYSSGSIVAKREWAGGIAGYMNNSKLIDSYTTASTQADNRGGGLVGGFYRTSEIINSYSKGSAWNHGIYEYTQGYGGLIGANDHAGGQNVVLHSYYDRDVGRVDRPFSRSTSQMTKASNYIDWDFENVWRIDEGIGYPTFRWQ